VLIDLFKAAFLGIVEGLTEFLPVSSTAHLLITSYLIDFTSIKNNLFEIVIQYGAILAICVLYRRKILDIILGLNQQRQKKFVLNVAVAFLPAAIIGATLHSYITKYLFSNFTIALALIIGGILMIVIDRKPYESSDARDMESITPLTAFYIGLFQCLAMVPGVSRSGATIIGGLLLGLKRKSAAEFSFFLAIPTIAAASLYDLLKNSSELTTSGIGIILVGLLFSFISAILVVKWFMNFISKHNFFYFGIYRIAVGILILLFLI
jgi:undecaprenyl-diphosphatase